MIDTERLREHVHGMWAGVAPAWEERADFVDRRAETLTGRILERAGLRPGARVLELASGPGGAGLAAAALVGPEGDVVISDVVPAMAEAAARRAAARDLTNVRTAVLDLEAIDEPDAAFDVVLCREGLMFAVDPAASAGEIRRVLRPGGLAVVSVWGPRGRNPWLGVVFDVVGEELGRQLPPPGVPGPFALADADRLGALLASAPLDDVAIEEVDVPLRLESFDQWWTHMTTLAGPLATMLASLPPEPIDAIRKRLRDALDDYATTAGYELPGVALLASGRRGGTG
jgi:ubiquinone/menaquinone biosynthesis C-methylase UbiE